MGGGTAGATTQSGFFDRNVHRYGRARRIWIKDRGNPRRGEPGPDAQHRRELPGGHAEGRLTRLEQAFPGEPRAKVREDLQVKRQLTDEDV